MRNNLPAFFLTAALAALGFASGAAAVSAAPVVVAQAVQPPAGQAPPPAGGHRVHYGAVLQSLNLSDDQKTKIRSIIQSARAENQNVTDRETKRANMKAAFVKVEAILTPAQRDELHAKLKALRAQQGAPQGAPQGQGQPAQ
jgi:Spy/CpxP family protein refolding chaperone